MFVNIFFLVVILSSDSCFSLNCDTRPLPSNMSSYKVHCSLSFFIGGYLNGPTCIAHSWLIVVIIFGIICDLFFSALIYNVVPVLVLCGPTIFYSLCFSIFICNLGVDGLLQSYWIVCQYWWNIVSEWFGLWTWHIKPDSWFCQTLIHVKGSSDEFIDANIQLVLAVVRKLQERKETKACIVRRGSSSFIWIFVTFHLKQWGLTRHPNFRFFLISQKSAGPLRFSKQHLTQ